MSTGVENFSKGDSPPSYGAVWFLVPISREGQIVSPPLRTPMKVAYRISLKNKTSLKKLSDLPTLVPERQLVPRAENSRSRGRPSVCLSRLPD